MRADGGRARVENRVSAQETRHGEGRNLPLVNKDAEEAVRFYVSIVPDSGIDEVRRAPDA